MSLATSNSENNKLKNKAFGIISGLLNNGSNATAPETKINYIIGMVVAFVNMGYGIFSAIIKPLIGLISDSLETSTTALLTCFVNACRMLFNIITNINIFEDKIKLTASVI
jgi:hypothetical protein